MKLVLNQDYPADLDRLWAVFGQTDYPERKYRALGATAVKMMRFRATPELIEVELERTWPVSADKLPSWARAYVGDEQTMRHHTLWRRVGPKEANAELRLTPEGVPVDVRGTASIAEIDPGKTRMTLRFDVRCRIPLVGAKVAKLFAQEIEEALTADHAYTLRYLREVN